MLYAQEGCGASGPPFGNRVNLENKKKKGSIYVTRLMTKAIYLRNDASNIKKIGGSSYLFTASN